MLENVQMVRSHGEKLYQSLYTKYISFSDEGGSRKGWFKYLKSFEDVEIIDRTCHMGSPTHYLHVLLNEGPFDRYVIYDPSDYSRGENTLVLIGREFGEKILVLGWP